MTRSETTKNGKKPLTSKSLPILNEVVDVNNNNGTIHTSQEAHCSRTESIITDTFESATNILSVLSNEEDSQYYPTEEEIKKIGWELYTSKLKELRSLLHIEYLNQYLTEDLIPKGLRIRLKPGIDDEDLEQKWQEILHDASKKLIKELVIHHSRKLEETLKDRTALDRKMMIIWDEEDKTEFIQDIDESIENEKNQLVEMKERKMERDRRFTRTQKPSGKRPSAVKYSDIVKRHIQDKIKENTRSVKPTEKEPVHAKRIAREEVTTASTAKKQVRIRMPQKFAREKRHQYSNHRENPYQRRPRYYRQDDRQSQTRYDHFDKESDNSYYESNNRNRPHHQRNSYFRDYHHRGARFKPKEDRNSYRDY